MKLKKTVVSLSHIGWAYHSETYEATISAGKYLINAPCGTLLIEKKELDEPSPVQNKIFSVPIVSFYIWTVEAKNPTETLKRRIKEVLELYRTNVDLVLRGLLRD